VCPDGSIDFGEDSCETIARYIYEKLSEMGFKVKRVEVSEDGFNAGCYGYV
jgi:ribosome-binding factor A